MNSRPLTVRRWSLDEWMNGEAAWTELLCRSSSDRLFLSWEWLTHWWRVFGRRLGCTPNLLAFYRDQKLVGVAPLYRKYVIRGGVAPARSVQLIGLSWRDPAPLISEYLDVVATRGEEQSVRQACFAALLDDVAWTELIVGLTAAGRQWRDVVTLEAYRAGYYVRELDRSVSYQANLGAGFDAYLRSLGQSTRRNLWGLRRRLGLHGEVRFEQVGAEEITSAFTDLNRLHQARWSKPAFAGVRLSFHMSLATRLAPAGELSLSRLRVGGKVVSVLYDIRKGSCQYNIKMGFDPTFNRGVSLGLIHLGYAMEAAAADNLILYDFLVGPGQSTDYKQHLSQSRRYLSSLQIVRGRLLPRLYRWHDRAPY